jgi:hypothetical protein
VQRPDICDERRLASNLRGLWNAAGLTPSLTLPRQWGEDLLDGYLKGKVFVIKRDSEGGV